jgi:hypothetical protein
MYTVTIPPAGMLAVDGNVKRRRWESRNHQPPIASAVEPVFLIFAHSPLSTVPSVPSASQLTHIFSGVDWLGPTPQASRSKMFSRLAATTWLL